MPVVKIFSFRYSCAILMRNIDEDKRKIHVSVKKRGFKSIHIAL